MAPARISPWRRMRRSRVPSNGPGRFFASQFSAGCTTDMSGFDFDRHNGAVRCVASCASLCRAYDARLAQSGSTEEVLAAFFYGREDIIPEMFSRLQKTLAGARRDNESLRHFIYYIERHIELDGDSHGPMGRELLEGLVADSPERHQRALHAACNSIRARIVLSSCTLSTLREMRAAWMPSPKR